MTFHGKVCSRACPNPAVEQIDVPLRLREPTRLDRQRAVRSRSAAQFKTTTSGWLSLVFGNALIRKRCPSADGTKLKQPQILACVSNNRSGDRVCSSSPDPSIETAMSERLF